MKKARRRAERAQLQLDAMSTSSPRKRRQTLRGDDRRRETVKDSASPDQQKTFRTQRPCKLKRRHNHRPFFHRLEPTPSVCLHLDNIALFDVNLDRCGLDTERHPLVVGRWEPHRSLDHYRRQQLRPRYAARTLFSGRQLPHSLHRLDAFGLCNRSSGAKRNNSSTMRRFRKVCFHRFTCKRLRR